MVFYRRNLPHWHPVDKSYFVTWRLAGSLPRGVLRKPSTTGRRPVATSDATSHTTLDDVFPSDDFLDADAWLDRALDGPVWLRDPRVAQMVVDALHFGETQLKLYSLSAYVVMPNHVHVLWTPRVLLERITRRLKGFTSLQANRILNRSGRRFWQEESFDHWIRNESQFDHVARYIQNNPVKASLVRKSEDWQWSSASR